MEINSALKNRSSAGALIGGMFGIVVFVIGIINTFWGNDPGFGIFLILVSSIYFPMIDAFIKNRIGFSIPQLGKVALGIFVIWAALGVGELFDKIDLMLASI
ncbi:hypothetical protein [Hymenobacter sp. CRA2]|uniref:hypothetical protein n=1 Tax=Hymenobacter sp. CRA2 TaxID=1955620 RepID=UPI00098F51B8|nr:hypothetical protein [Hymenobacter sp. CRA2]OON66062.1 hypothetical protein B0919_22475 [Hymenobacter sp. CRA2]